MNWVDNTVTLAMSPRMKVLLERNKEVQDILAEVFSREGSKLLRLDFELSTAFQVPNEKSIYALDAYQNVLQEIDFKHYKDGFDELQQQLER